MIQNSHYNHYIKITRKLAYILNQNSWGPNNILYSRKERFQNA